MRLLILALTVLDANGSALNSHLTYTAWEDVISDGGLHIGSGRSKRFLELNTTQLFGSVLPRQSDHWSESAPSDESPAITQIVRAENRGCGLSTRPTGRLVGARLENPRDWPWMASVTIKGFEQYCGGVLITDRHVLTAAHCTMGMKADELFVRLGEYDLKRTNDSRTYNFKVVEIKQHEGFDKSNYKDDVAILKLHRPAVFNTYVWPICLPPPGLKLVDETAIVIGWGTTFYGGPRSNVLMEVAVPIWEHKKCVESFTPTIFDENLCAGGPEGGKDSCQAYLSSSRWTVVGVVSWGVRCGEPEHPGVYTRVDKYLPWIAQNVAF